MEVIEKTLSKDRGKILRRAREFFDGRLGLSLHDEVEDCCLEFKTDLGFVNVQVSKRNGKTAVTLRSREYERQARKFIDNL